MNDLDEFKSMQVLRAKVMACEKLMGRNMQIKATEISMTEAFEMIKWLSEERRKFDDLALEFDEVLDSALRYAIVRLTEGLAAAATLQCVISKKEKHAETGEQG